MPNLHHYNKKKISTPVSTNSLNLTICSLNLSRRFKVVLLRFLNKQSKTKADPWTQLENDNRDVI